MRIGGGGGMNLDGGRAGPLWTSFAWGCMSTYNFSGGLFLWSFQIDIHRHVLAPLQWERALERRLKSRVAVLAVGSTSWLHCGYSKYL